jgi:hypothetical protein
VERLGAALRPRGPVPAEGVQPARAPARRTDGA